MSGGWWELWLHYGFEPYCVISSVSGVFWLVFRVFGWCALGIGSLLEESLADLFAVVYNIVLAAAYSAVLHLTIMRDRPQGSPAFWYLAFGFVFLYVVLGMTYSDSWSERLDDFSLLGYGAGVLSYLAFAVWPASADIPPAILLLDFIKIFRDSLIGFLFSVLGTATLVAFLYSLLIGRRSAGA